MIFDCAVWTGMQLNRQGMNSTDVDMTDVADSFAVAATSDFMLSIMRTEELDNVNKILCKQIKSRYGNKSDLLRFTIGVNQKNQQYYNVEQPYQVKERVEANEFDKVGEILLRSNAGGTAGKFASLK